MVIRQLDFHFLGADKVAGKQVSRDCVGAGKTKKQKKFKSAVLGCLRLLQFSPIVQRHAVHGDRLIGDYIHGIYYRRICRSLSVDFTCRVYKTIRNAINYVKSPLATCF